MRGKAWWIVIIAVIILSLGPLALRGDPWGYLGLLVAGGSGTMYWLATRSPRRRAGPVGTGISHGTLPGADRYTASPMGLVFAGRRAFPVIAGAAVFLIVGLAFLVVGLAEGMSGGLFFVVLGVVMLVGSGVFGVQGGRSLFVSPGGIALLPEGVYLWHPAGRAWVRWDDLAQAYVAVISGQPNIMMLANAPNRIKLTGLVWLLRHVNRAMWGIDVSLSGNYFRTDPEEVISTITHYWQNPPAREQLAAQPPKPDS